MTVDLVDNPEKYEDIYPSSSEDESSEDEEEDEDKPQEESPETKALAKELAEVDESIKKADEARESAISQLSMLNKYTFTLKKSRPANLEGCITAYREERKKAADLEFSHDKEAVKLRKRRDSLTKKFDKAIKATYRQNLKAIREKVKQREKREAAAREKAAAKQRLKEERTEFWPKKVYRVTLSLDNNTDLTPVSSRGESTTSLAKSVLKDASSQSCQISLALSYITSSAWWSPRYDLNLNTLKNTGLIIYRAEFCNTTSEKWNDTKVTLSTSQTSFQGLSEPIPTMFPWHVRLKKNNGKDGTSDALFSTDELQYKQKKLSANRGTATTPRDVLFGLVGSSSSSQPNSSAMAQQRQIAQAQAYSAHGLSQTRSKGQNPLTSDGRFERVGGYALASKAEAEAGEESDEDMGFGLWDDGPSITPDVPKLSEPESSWSESGLTTSYDIPGNRTITPSFTKRRHRVASVPLADITFSHIIVPKLRPAAFLKARIRNNSTITLLKGPVGLTLDGSFLGNTSLPRCSAGESLSISLGVDPSINVTYAKPAVKRSQTGMFSKDNNGVYTRTCTITNTKSNRALEGLILDQIPLSEDERLRVEVLQPAGLIKEGDVVRSGVSLSEKGNENWGSAKAVMKKGGEVCWEVKVEPGKGGKFVLEYEARFPTGDAVVNSA